MAASDARPYEGLRVIEVAEDPAGERRVDVGVLEPRRDRLPADELTA